MLKVAVITLRLGAAKASAVLAWHGVFKLGAFIKIGSVFHGGYLNRVLNPATLTPDI